MGETSFPPMSIFLPWSRSESKRHLIGINPRTIKGRGGGNGSALLLRFLLKQRKSAPAERCQFVQLVFSLDLMGIQQMPNYAVGMVGTLVACVLEWLAWVVFLVTGEAVMRDTGQG